MTMANIRKEVPSWRIWKPATRSRPRCNVQPKDGRGPVLGVSADIGVVGSDVTMGAMTKLMLVNGGFELSRPTRLGRDTKAPSSRERPDQSFDQSAESGRSIRSHE